MKMRHLLMTAPALLLAAGGVSAQTYPSKTVRFIVPYTPGGAADILARAVGAKLTEAWGQSVVVENRAGAGTNLGSEIAAKSPPDGYVLFMPTIANAINPTLYPKLNYDPVKDLVPVGTVAEFAFSFAVGTNPKVNAHA